MSFVFVHTTTELHPSHCVLGHIPLANYLLVNLLLSFFPFSLLLTSKLDMHLNYSPQSLFDRLFSSYVLLLLLHLPVWMARKWEQSRNTQPNWCNIGSGSRRPGTWCPTGQLHRRIVDTRGRTSGRRAMVGELQRNGKKNGGGSNEKALLYLCRVNIQLRDIFYLFCSVWFLLFRANEWRRGRRQAFITRAERYLWGIVGGWWCRKRGRMKLRVSYLLVRLQEEVGAIKPFWWTCSKELLHPQQRNGMVSIYWKVK